MKKSSIALTLIMSLVFIASAAQASIVGGIVFSFMFHFYVCKFINCFLSNKIFLIISSMAIFFVGLQAFVGKLSWTTCLTTVLALVVMLSSGKLLKVMGIFDCSTLTTIASSGALTNAIAKLDADMADKVNKIKTALSGGRLTCGIITP